MGRPVAVSKGFQILDQIESLLLAELISKRMPLIAQAEARGVVQEMSLVRGTFAGGRLLIAHAHPVELPADIPRVVLVEVGGWR